MLQEPSHCSWRSRSRPTPSGRYNQGLKTWRRWSSRLGINNLPVDRLHLAAFVTSVVQQGGKFGKVELVFYTLNWLNNVLDLPNPCNSCVSLRRTLSSFLQSRNALSNHVTYASIALQRALGVLWDTKKDLFIFFSSSANTNRSDAQALLSCL